LAGGPGKGVHSFHLPRVPRSSPGLASAGMFSRTSFREMRSLPVNRDSRSLAVNIADDCSSPPDSVLPPFLAYHAMACPASHTGSQKMHILSLHACVQGIVSLDSTIAFLDNLATPDGPALLPLSPLGTASGISSFSGYFSGTCGKTGGRGYMSGRIVFLVNSQPLSEVSARSPAPDARRPTPEARLWDFFVFRPFLWDVWENRGEGSGRLATRNSALGTRNSELGTGLPTCNFQPTTLNRFSPGYPGLVC
jgi:hypothetical protein